LAKYNVAQRIVPRVRRLHGDGAIPKGNRAIARRCCGSRPNGDHVRGSSLVALPSLAYFGLPQSAGSRSDAHSRHEENRAASVHIGGPNRERRVKLPARVALVGRLCQTPVRIDGFRCGGRPTIFFSAWISDAPEEQTDA